MLKLTLAQQFGEAVRERLNEFSNRVMKRFVTCSSARLFFSDFKGDVVGNNQLASQRRLGDDGRNNMDHEQWNARHPSGCT